MRQILIPVGAGLVGLVLGFQAMLGILPGFIMGKAMERFETLGGEPNLAGHFPPIDETARTVVRPSPDIIYSGCMYDVSNGAVAITLPALEDESYVSVSFFDARTNNFAAFNNRDFGGAAAEILLHGPAPDHTHTDPGYADYDVSVLAPTSTGLVLLRRVLSGGVTIEDADDHRRQFGCEAL
jgi:uncharacterized membrane protein